MLTVCWAAKGGSGTSVVAAGLALLEARRHRDGPPVLLVDLAGDVPAVLGLAPAEEPGAGDWLAAPDADHDGLDHLAVDVVAGLRLLSRGGTDPARAAAPDVDRLLAALDDRAGPTVVDAGTGPPGELHELARQATRSWLVTRACYLSLRRAVALPYRPSGVVLVEEPGRALRPADVHAVLGVPVVASVPADPGVARAVDAGLLSRRLPAQLGRPLERAA